MNLYIGIPTYDAWTPDFGLSLAVTMADLASHDGPTQMTAIRSDSSILPAGRTDLARDAMSKGATHILWCDTDMKFKPRNVRELLRHADDLDIVAATYRKRRPPHDYVAHDLGGQAVTPGNGLIEATHIGMGLAVMAIEVFEGLDMPWFGFPWDAEAKDYVGEDVVFCRKAREDGFRVWVDREASKGVGHVGKAIYGGVTDGYN